MADFVNINVTGLGDCEAILEKLYKDVAAKIIKDGLRAAGDILLEATRAIAPQDTGLLVNSLKVNTGRKTESGISVWVGTSSRLFVGKDFYAGMQELGHYAGSRKLGENRYWIKGKEFMKKAFDAKGQEATEAAELCIRDGIQAESITK